MVAAAFSSTTCTDCIPGTYSTAGNSVCINCVPGKFSAAGELCADCPVFSTSPEGSNVSTSCQCNAGYLGANGQTCVACSANTYQSSSTTCASCGIYSNSTPSGSSICFCRAEYEGSPCKLCQPGKYKDVAGSASCQSCLQNMYSGQFEDELMPYNKCYCNAGFSGDDDDAFYLFLQKLVWNYGCTQCPAGEYRKLDSLVTWCSLCGIRRTSLPDTTTADNCICNLGYYLDAAYYCILCLSGKYKDTTGSALCTSCPGATTLHQPV